MGQLMMDETLLREIVRLVVQIVIEEIERAGIANSGTGGCPSCAAGEALAVATETKPAGVSCSGRSSSGSSMVRYGATTGTPAPIDWRLKKLVLEHDIKSFGNGIEVIIGKRTIITPLAADTARERGVTFKKE